MAFRTVHTCAWLGVMLLACSNSSSPAPSESPRRDARARDSASGPSSEAGPREAATAGANGPSDAAARDANADDARVPARPVKSYVYQGGNGDDYPVRVFALDRSTGALTQLGEPVDLGASPTYLTPSTDGRHLYAANEVFQGGVTAASILADGKLERLGAVHVESGESSLNAMVFTSLSPNGRYVLAANYYGPSVSVFERKADGRLSGPVDTERFEAPAQSHSVRVHPSGRWAFVPNKDADSIAQLRFDSSTGALSPHDPPARASASGAGPRHIAFSPSGNYAYVSNENNSTVTAYRVTSQGLLDEIETVSSLPDGFSGSNTGAHVLVHPNGKYLYASNRGHDSIAVFAVGNGGALSLVEHTSTRGQTPRNFDIDDTGEFMVVANQSSGSLAVFRIGNDGRLTPLGQPVTGLNQPNAVAIVNRAQ